MGIEVIKPGKEVSTKKSGDDVGKVKSKSVRATKSRSIGKKSLARY